MDCCIRGICVRKSASPSTRTALFLLERPLRWIKIVNLPLGIFSLHFYDLIISLLFRCTSGVLNMYDFKSLSSATTENQEIIPFSPVKMFNNLTTCITSIAFNKQNTICAYSSRSNKDQLRLVCFLHWFLSNRFICLQWASIRIGQRPKLH